MNCTIGNKQLFWLTAGAVCIGLSACSSEPQRVVLLDQARTAVRTAEADPQASKVAPIELDKAESSLAEAERLHENGADIARIGQEAYLAKQHAAIVQTEVETAQSQKAIAQGDAERSRILAQARERQADQQPQEAQAAEQKGESLAQQITELQAQDKQSKDRGTVPTLNDALFDTGKARLEPGAQASLDRLAQFMQQNPDRIIRIQGYTDSRGPNAYNVQLSQRRADAVRNALVMKGISPDRITTRGYGEEYPVASNDTAAGRQLNRRVEIVVSNGEGQMMGAETEEQVRKRGETG